VLIESAAAQLPTRWVDFRRDLSVLETFVTFWAKNLHCNLLKSRCLGFGLSCSCSSKYASSGGRGYVVMPEGFPRSVGRVECRLLSFPCFPYSVISLVCFGSRVLTESQSLRRPVLETGTTCPRNRLRCCRRLQSVFSGIAQLGVPTVPRANPVR
jgi:hypothetical protein